jgi:lysosomal alpha-mannosidase
MLVKENRLSFVLAAWSMSDEASVYYEDFINNVQAGNEYLEKELGFRPTIGWQIDPFGHHSATAALFADMRFDAIFFARIDYQDKEKRLEEKSMEFLWRPMSENRGNSTEILAHMMYQHYSAPRHFCFSIFCDDDAIVEDPLLETYNINEKVDELHEYFLHMSKHYRTKNIM